METQPSKCLLDFPRWMLHLPWLQTTFVSLAKTIRPRIARFSFVFIALGVCVFTWGLQYKLSLYYPAHSTYHQVPEAKLLSRDEQPRTTASLQVIGQKDSSSGDIYAGFLSLMLAWFTGLALYLLPECRWNPARKKPWLAAARASLDPFFFRPPPISA